MFPLRARKYSLCENLCVWPWPSPPFSTIHSTTGGLAVGPAIAAGTPIILKPLSEKRPDSHQVCRTSPQKWAVRVPCSAFYWARLKKLPNDWHRTNESKWSASPEASASVLSPEALATRSSYWNEGMIPDHSEDADLDQAVHLACEGAFSEFRSALYGRQTHHGSTIHPEKIHSSNGGKSQKLHGRRSLIHGDTDWVQ